MIIFLIHVFLSLLVNLDGTWGNLLKYDNWVYYLQPDLSNFGFDIKNYIDHSTLNIKIFILIIIYENIIFFKLFA